MILMNYLEEQTKQMETLYQESIKNKIVNDELFLSMTSTYADMLLVCS